MSDDGKKIFRVSDEQWLARILLNEDNSQIFEDRKIDFGERLDHQFYFKVSSDGNQVVITKRDETRLINIWDNTQSTQWVLKFG